MRITREFSIPSHVTFDMLPVSILLDRYLAGAEIIIDPFARNSKRGTITNDLNPDTEAEFHMQAEDFCDYLLDKNVIADVVLFDPPYTIRQMKEMYQSIGLEFTNKESQLITHWRNVKDKLARIIKPGGVAISFGYSTIGLGKLRGLEIIEIMIINHGSGHYDTLVTVEKKIQGQLM